MEEKSAHEIAVEDQPHDDRGRFAPKPPPPLDDTSNQTNPKSHYKYTIFISGPKPIEDVVEYIKTNSESSL